jgi:hypothetical protein
MRTAFGTAAVLFCLVLASGSRPEGRGQTPAAAPASPQRALINQYCLGCHNDKAKIGGLSLNDFNPDAAGQHAEIAEKVIRKLRGGLMPPAGVRRPDGKAAAEFVSFLETRIDAGLTAPAPGRVPLRRLNRREYQYAIRDLLGLNIDAAAWLPDDNVKGNFDNNAAALQVSPNFIDQYIYAARAVALEAIGNPKAPAETITYGDVANMVISLPPDGADGGGRQQHHIEGLPFGTRGGFLVEHNFPADGEYELTIGDMALAREVPRMEFENTVIALLDGKEFYRTNIGGEVDHKNIDQKLDPAVEEINGRLRKIRFKTTAGQHKLGITFLHRSFAESDERTRTIALEGGQERIQAAHALQIRGPLSVTGISQSPSRSKIFICEPASARSGREATRQAVLAGRSASRTDMARQAGAALARHGFGERLGAVDLLKTIGSRQGALAIEEARNVPEVGKYSNATERQAVLDYTLERGKARTLDLVAKRFHRAVAVSRRNHRARRGATFRSQVNRSARPLERGLAFEKRWVQQDEHAEVDVVCLEESGSASERVDGHALVQTGKCFGVGGLEANRDFQSCGTEPILKAQAPLSVCARQKSRVRFNDDAVQAFDKASDSSVLIRWDRGRIEEAAGIIQLDLTHRR